MDKKNLNPEVVCKLFLTKQPADISKYFPTFQQVIVFVFKRFSNASFSDRCNSDVSFSDRFSCLNKANATTSKFSFFLPSENKCFLINLKYITVT